MPLRFNDHRANVERECERYATRPVELLPVADVAAWAVEHSVRIAGNPIACALSQHDGDRWLILIREEISEDRFNQVLGRLDIRGYWAETANFRNDRSAFLRHLVLHELAHLENNWDQSHEDECDEWAFQRLAT